MDRESPVDKEHMMMMFATLLALTGIQGCKWQDDFRTREQPAYLQQPQYVRPVPKPTLNVDSRDYQGDDTNKTANELKRTKLPAIDGRSPIPALPDHPAGA
jgi:hypothetical protein